jgi:homoserine dehydrogenase
LNNEYTSRVLMVLARELGISRSIEVGDIQEGSDKLLEVILNEKVDCLRLSSGVDQKVKARVDAAASRRCVLRHVSSVDVTTKAVEVKLVEVPEHHVFAVTPPSCVCVRFFTQRHRQYPLIIQGPSAGADSTASALLAELLHLMRGKATPRSVALSRSDSGLIAEN